MGIVAVIFSLYVARPVIVPILAAVVVGLVVAPLSERVQRMGVRPLYANLALATILTGIFALLYFFASQGVSNLVADLPRQIQTIADLLMQALEPLERIQASINGGAAKGSAAAIDVKSIALYVVSSFSPAVAQVFIFIFALILFSLDRAFLKRSLVMAFRDRDARLDALRFVNKLEADLSRYLSIAFVVNGAVGTLTALLLFLLGMPGYLLLGVCAFVLNFLPFVGPIALKALLAVLGLAAFPTFFQGMLPVLAYTLVVLVESNAITPYLVGRQFSVRPIVVFIAIVFLSWLWGLAGALLALPLVVIASTLIQSFVTEESVPLPG